MRLGSLVQTKGPFTDDRTVIVAALKGSIADVQGIVAHLETIPDSR
jgi:hypothetical protein